MTDKLVIDILEYIEKNLYNGIKVETIADNLHYSRFYLVRLFKKYTGLTLNDYINERKIIKSIYYLVNTDNRILNIALNNGFNSLEYYSEMFYKVTNYSPLEFRKNDKLKKYLPFDYSSNLYESLNINKVILNNIRNTKKTSKIIVKQLKNRT